MSFKKMYYYLFYKLFKLTEVLKSTFLNKMKAIIMLIALEVWFEFTLFNYYEFFRHKNIKLDFFSLEIILPLLAILVIKWFAFIRDDMWKQYIQEFDSWPKDKNTKGTWMIVGLVVFIIANFILSSYIKSPSQFRW